MKVVVALCILLNFQGKIATAKHEAFAIHDKISTVTRIHRAHPVSLRFSASNLSREKDGVEDNDGRMWNPLVRLSERENFPQIMTATLVAAGVSAIFVIGMQDLGIENGLVANAFTENIHGDGQSGTTFLSEAANPLSLSGRESDSNWSELWIASSSASVDWSSILTKASKRALGGGKAGASAAVVQVLTLMWLRTAMNYQYRYGGTLGTSLSLLYNEGGIARLYQGLPFALVQGPLTRFGDTAANVGILALLDALPLSQSWPLPIRTACASLAAGAWRIFCMPIDTSKTAMQVEGQQGLQTLWERIRAEGNPGPLYQGAFASAAATAVGHYPWFLTYNFLDQALPPVDDIAALFALDESAGVSLLLLKLLRQASLGLSASCISDCCSNSLRVIKTTKQTAQLGVIAEQTATPITKDAKEAGILETTNSSPREISYREAVSIILEKDGWIGLFGRGLQTRLLTNALQGAMFSVLWKFFQTR